MLNIEIYAPSRRDDIFVTADFNRRTELLTFLICHVVTSYFTHNMPSLRDNHQIMHINPPIEIGGYKYAVPIGR